MVSILQSLGVPTPGARILHFAPELGVANLLRSIVGSANYHARDIDPARYRKIPEVRKFDLCRDSFDLPPEHYDLIIHSHVMEHIPCAYPVVLYNLHRSLRQNGYHVCSIPVLPGRYEETMESLSGEEATRRFGQHDHVRRFGRDDLQLSLGMVFRIADEYDITRIVEPAALIAANVPERCWRGYSPDSVLVLRKNDLRLV